MTGRAHTNWSSHVAKSRWPTRSRNSDILPWINAGMICPLFSIVSACLSYRSQPGNGAGGLIISVTLFKYFSRCGPASEEKDMLFQDNHFEQLFVLQGRTPSRTRQPDSTVARKFRQRRSGRSRCRRQRLARALPLGGPGALRIAAGRASSVNRGNRVGGTEDEISVVIGPPLSDLVMMHSPK